MKPSNVHRRAVYEAFGSRCFYCARHLTYGEAELEHLVPKELSADEERRRTVLESYGLPQAYDLEGDQNIVLSCRPCNGKKADHQFLPGQMAILLADANAKGAKVRSLRIKYGRVLSNDKLALALVAAYEDGASTPAEIENLLWKYYGQSQIRLTDPLSFVGRPEVRSLCFADLEDLWEAPLKLRDHPCELTFFNDDGRTLQVGTCRQYVEAHRLGFYVRTNGQIKMCSLFEKAIAVLYALEHAEPARESFISSPRLGLCDLRVLSVSLAPFEFGDDGEVLGTPPAKTLLDLKESGLLEVVDFSSLSLQFKFNGLITSLTEVLRADVNHDGVEEILVLSYNRADGGTLGFGYAMFVGRNGDDQLISRLDIALPYD